MKILIERKYKKEDYTIGSLFINGQWMCNTMELKDRGLTQSMDRLTLMKEKVFEETAITAGSYRVRMQRSVKLKGLRPFVLDVPGFRGIMIHEGNTPRDTKGCILVGMNTVKGRLSNSKECLTKIIDMITKAEKQGEVVVISLVSAYRRTDLPGN